MSDSLDLTSHSIPEVPGKRVSINGCAYVFERLIWEGSKSFVYPLRNERSQLILFVGKILKFGPGTPEAERKSTDIPILSFGKKHQVPRDVGSILHTECYEAGGAVLIFQEHLGTERPNHEAFFESLIIEAQTAVAASDPHRALLCYERVLMSNPQHSLAMLNKALCLSHFGAIDEALSLLERVRDVEPNEPRSYRASASLLCEMGKIEAALTMIGRALARCPWDLDSWTCGMNIATDFELPERAEAYLASVRQWDCDGTVAEEWRPKIDACRERRSRSRRTHPGDFGRRGGN